MNIHDYLIDQSGHDWSEILSQWHWLLPREFTLWLVNRYGDAFLVTESGTVLMLDVGGGSIKQVADTREDFIHKIDEGNNANDWLVIPLVDRCVSAGLTLGNGQCYSYRVPPLLGGDYTVENTEVVNLEVHYSVYAQIHEQIKDLPDGTKIELKMRQD